MVYYQERVRLRQTQWHPRGHFRPLDSDHPKQPGRDQTECGWSWNRRVLRHCQQKGMRGCQRNRAWWRTSAMQSLRCGQMPVLELPSSRASSALSCNQQQTRAREWRQRLSGHNHTSAGLLQVGLSHDALCSVTEESHEHWRHPKTMGASLRTTTCMTPWTRGGHGDANMAGTFEGVTTKLEANRRGRGPVYIQVLDNVPCRQVGVVGKWSRKWAAGSRRWNN